MVKTGKIATATIQKAGKLEHPPPFPNSASTANPPVESNRQTETRNFVAGGREGGREGQTECLCLCVLLSAEVVGPNKKPVPILAILKNPT